MNKSQENKILLTPFLTYFNTFVSLMGSHITFVIFELHVPYSKFCKDGLMMGK